MAEAAGKARAKAKAKAAPRPLVWKVTGGASSGGLVVRQGLKLSSPECHEKLATGAVVQEIDRSGERLQYRRLRGGGPETGWVSCSVKGKELLTKQRFKVWIMCCGSRGDFQPFLALSLGLQRAGFDVLLWTHADFQAHAEHHGVPCIVINPSSETTNKQLLGVDAEGASKQANLFWSRCDISRATNTRIGGVWWLDDIPKDILLANITKGFDDLQSFMGQMEDDARKQFSVVYQNAMKVIEEAREQELAAAQVVPADTGAMAGPPAPDAAQPTASKGKWPYPEGSDEWNLAQEMAQNDFSDDIKQFRWGELVSRVGMFASNDKWVGRLKEELERAPPDIIMANALLILLAWNIGKQLDVPVTLLALQYLGLHLMEPGAKWITEELWPQVQRLEGSGRLVAHSSLKEAREKYDMDAADFWEIAGNHQLLTVAEQVLVKPALGTTALADLGFEEFQRRWTSGALVGFITAVTSDRFLEWMGPHSRKMVKRHLYCGYWMLDEEDETTNGAVSAFGGPELKGRVERFIAAGPKPVYVGFGSCGCGRGRHWMCYQAARSLQLAGKRAIVLTGWAGLSLDLLMETVGADDDTGLVSFARENILFVEKVSQAWLFPQCSLLLIHGGVGTLGAAWASGTPTLVWPVWIDQPMNGQLHTLLQAGKCLPRVDDSDPAEVARAIQSTSESKEAQTWARTIQFSMMRDKGIAKATEHLDQVLVHDAPAHF